MRTTGLLLAVVLFPAIAFASSININTADSNSLQTLPGIGSSKAAAIIDYRTEHGPFATIDDIQNVSGIGPATFANIQSLITVDDQGAQTPAPDPSPPAPEPEQPVATASVAPTEPININTADATLLETLAGIGPSKSAAIIEYRTKNGPFSTIADIQNVSGIGPATFANIQALITVGTVDTSPTSSPPPATNPPAQNPSPAPTQSTALININTASAGELDALPGIGPSKASAIVQYRGEHGLFASVNDIQNVSGIGPATFANIKALITVGVAIVKPKVIVPVPPPVTPTATATTTPTPVSPQPSPTVESYKEVQAVEPISKSKATTQAHAQTGIAPTASTELAAVGAVSTTAEAAPPPKNAHTKGLLHSPWLVGLIVVVVIASGTFILL